MLIRSPFALDIDLPPLQTSMHATDSSLQQCYFPEANSTLGGSLFNRAVSTAPHSRQPWSPLNQRGLNPFGLPTPHDSSTQPTFSAGGSLGLNQGHRLPSLFHASQDSQTRSSIFYRSQPAHELDDFPIGQLERHYLTQLQSSGSPRDVGPGGVADTRAAAGGVPLQGLSWENGHVQGPAPLPQNPLGFMNAEQRILQHQHRHFGSNNPSSSAVYEPAEHEPMSQGAMNLDQLSALMQAERSQALPALQSRQPLSFAHSYLTSLRMVSPFSREANAPPVASDPHPLYGELLHSQGRVSSSWERVQRPVQSMQHSIDHAPGTAEAQAAQGRVSLQYCEPSLQDDQDLLSGLMKTS